MSERLKNKIAIIRKTAANLAASSEYQWGHMGACNCGHLAQQITFKSKAEIHNRAMTGLGDWNDQSVWPLGPELVVAVLFGPVVAPGQGAPAFTQSRMLATCSRGSLPLGGIA